MFTTGKIIFALVFALAFILFMVWSYRKDHSVTSSYYKNTSKTFLFILLVFTVLFLFVKFRKYL
jgi:hypothetical protein